MRDVRRSPGSTFVATDVRAAMRNVRRSLRQESGRGRRCEVAAPNSSPPLPSPHSACPPPRAGPPRPACPPPRAGLPPPAGPPPASGRRGAPGRRALPSGCFAPPERAGRPGRAARMQGASK
jgi:hypothetical protein